MADPISLSGASSVSAANIPPKAEAVMAECSAVIAQFNKKVDAKGGGESGYINVKPTRDGNVEIGSTLVGKQNVKTPEEAKAFVTSMTPYLDKLNPARIAATKDRVTRSIVLTPEKPPVKPPVQPPAQPTQPAAAPAISLSGKNGVIIDNNAAAPAKTKSAAAPVEETASTLTDKQIDEMIPALMKEIPEDTRNGWDISHDGLKFIATRKSDGKQVFETAASATKEVIEKAITPSVMSLRRSMEMEDNNVVLAKNLKNKGSVGATNVEQQSSEETAAKDLRSAINKLQTEVSLDLNTVAIKDKVVAANAMFKGGRLTTGELKALNNGGILTRDSISKATGRFVSYISETDQAALLKALDSE